MSSEGNKKQPPKRPVNSFSLLQMTMNEVEKSKKSTMAPETKNSEKSNGGTSVKKEQVSETHSSKEEMSKYNKNPSPNRDPNVPDRSYGDYFCTVCDSHMNSEAMWDAHVTGKRHIKNVKKGESDSKYDDLEGVESHIKYELRNVKDPIIGLSYIHEIRRREPNVPAMYNCFLCHASIATVPLVIEHVISMKHRLNYMKENCPEEYQLLGATNLKKGHMEPLVFEAALKMEQKYGRGTVKVKQEKPKRQVTTYKRSYHDDDDDDDKSKSSKNPKPDIWKSVDSQKRNSGRRDRSDSPRNRKRRSYSDDDDDDCYRRPRSPIMRRHVSPRRDDYNKSYSKQSDYDDHRKKPDYDDHRKKSDYDDHQKKPDYNDHRRRSDYDDYPKSNVRASYNLSPPRYEQQSSYAHQEYQPVRPYQPNDNLLPHERVANQPVSFSDPNILKDFLLKFFALPTDSFLKVVLHKMENMELKGIDELSLLSKLIKKAQDLLCNHLPPELKAALKQKMSQNSEGSTQKSSILGGIAESITMARSLTAPNIPDVKVPPSELNTETSYKPPTQSSLNFIKDFLNSVKSASSTPPSVQSASATQNVNPIPYPPPSAYPSQYPNSYETRPPNPYQNPPPSLNVNPVPYQNLQNQNVNSSSYQNPPPNQNMNSAPFQNPPPNQNINSAPYQNPPPNQNMNPGYKSAAFPNANRPYQNNNAHRPSYSSASHPNAQYQNSNTSVPAQNYSYSSSQPSIPGLTLTEQSSPEPKSYDDYKQYSPASNKASLSSSYRY